MSIAGNANAVQAMYAAAQPMPLRDDERQRAGRRRADAPAVLGHARTDAELVAGFSVSMR